MAHIQRPVADALDVAADSVTAIGINEWFKWTTPGGSSWIDFFGLLEVDDYVEQFERM